MHAHFVQFPHPGAEHRVRTGSMPWNTGNHRRKFLVAPGSYSPDGRLLTRADLVFWGEWEPPSSIEETWTRDGQLPRALHRPFWFQHTGRGYLQNTDPWVFGGRMLYSNCKQLAKGRPTGMQRLERGSVIAFGSAIGDAFCLDTVFVVADSEPWTPSDGAQLDVDAAFRACTVAPLLSSPRNRRARFTFYRGATFESPVQGMYSFVPALAREPAASRFARPPVRHPFINPRSKQAAAGSAVPRPSESVAQAWHALRDQVLDAGLVLGTRLETPPRRAGKTTPVNGRTRC